MEEKKIKNQNTIEKKSKNKNKKGYSSNTNISSNSSSFDQLRKKIINRNILRPFPDINKIPN